MNTATNAWPQPPKHPLRPVSVYRFCSEREYLDRSERDVAAGRTVSWEEVKRAVFSPAELAELEAEAD